MAETEKVLCSSEEKSEEVQKESRMLSDEELDGVAGGNVTPVLLEGPLIAL